MDKSIFDQEFHTISIPIPLTPKQEIQNHDLSIFSIAAQKAKAQDKDDENAAFSTADLVVVAFDSKFFENSSSRKAKA